MSWRSAYASDALRNLQHTAGEDRRVVDDRHQLRDRDVGIIQHLLYSRHDLRHARQREFRVRPDAGEILFERGRVVRDDIVDGRRSKCDGRHPC